jgi:hypothetical protein
MFPANFSPYLIKYGNYLKDDNAIQRSIKKQ